MPTQTISGRTVELDEDGCLLRSEQWDSGLAAGLAAREGIRLTDEHWQVLRFLRQRYLEGEAPPSCRVVAQRCGMTVKQLFRLFPHRPVHVAAKVAGLPDPHQYIGGCGRNWWSRWR